MPSVNVTWSGSSSDVALQDNLSMKLWELGELSHSHFESNIPVQVFDGPLSGGVLIRRDAFPVNAPICTNPLKRSPLQNGIDLRPAGPRRTPKGSDGDLYWVDGVRLRGVQFRLFDGRHLYDGEDRVSFLFVSVEGMPEVEGTLVQVEGREDCSTYQDEVIQCADWFITAPKIHLRGYCEEWMDLMLAWVKHFHIANLDYWRYEAMPNWDSYHATFVRGGDQLDLEEFSFQFLKEEFRQEVQRWADVASSVHDFWTSMKKLQPPE